MIPQDLKIPGLKVFQLKIHRDDRGFFVERYKAEWDLPKFIQDNHSFSKPGVIRGLHYQSNPAAQGKLVGCTRGRIWDVAVDLRAKSPTYGQWEGVELSAENGKLLWIPPGFAHGFCVLDNEDADVTYKVDAPYSAPHDGGIRYDDPTLKILWPIDQTSMPLTVSDKDRALQSFEDYKKNPLF
ncbi:MAG: dTDP-4-dehydrorhamnose 3,5-epimerase [Bdellovibrionales bacterium]|nr:dTDP-4-dehydrorhamnose 3,5-epimerase [Bdellovibrionales bacterium]